ncbi:hypothetical protein, partial [Streptomyces acidiscabies]|uniref:hypothetical protein n=1 Tax=Streptomyces acidiscabies TaxID=42234 RepID=UPI001C4B1EBD
MVRGAEGQGQEAREAGAGVPTQPPPPDPTRLALAGHARRAAQAPADNPPGIQRSSPALTEITGTHHPSPHPQP